MVRVIADVVVGVKDRDKKLVEMNGRSNVRVKVEAMDFFSESSTAVWVVLGPAGGGDEGSVGGWRLDFPSVQCCVFLCVFLDRMRVDGIGGDFSRMILGIIVVN